MDPPPLPRLNPSRLLFVFTPFFSLFFQIIFSFFNFNFLSVLLSANGAVTFGRNPFVSTHFFLYKNRWKCLP